MLNGPSVTFTAESVHFRSSKGLGQNCHEDVMLAKVQQVLDGVGKA